MQQRGKYGFWMVVLSQGIVLLYGFAFFFIGRWGVFHRWLQEIVILGVRNMQTLEGTLKVVGLRCFTLWNSQTVKKNMVHNWIPAFCVEWGNWRCYVASSI